MEWVGIRELANRASAIVDEVSGTGRPALITKHGRPVAALVPLDEDALQDWVNLIRLRSSETWAKMARHAAMRAEILSTAWVLTHAPEFTEALAEADEDLGARRTRPAFEFLDELEEAEAGGS